MKLSKRAIAKRSAYSRWKHKVAIPTFEDKGLKHCFKCGTTYFLDIDHIIPRSKDSSKIMDIGNCQILCRACHMKKTKLEGRHDYDNIIFLSGGYDAE